MAWFSYTFAAVIQPPQTVESIEPRALLSGVLPTDPIVHTASRNGRLLQRLEAICGCARVVSNLYLLEDQSLLQGATLLRQHGCVRTLLAEIERNPKLVLEATKEWHSPFGTLHAEGFQPLPYELVYPRDAEIRGDWVYFHTEDEVRSLLASAMCGADPKPPTDDDGESLEYVFGVLKSHESLLRVAAERGLAVAYAEMNPVS